MSNSKPAISTASGEDKFPARSSDPESASGVPATATKFRGRILALLKRRKCE